jgi:hypothetical protein
VSLVVLLPACPETGNTPTEITSLPRDWINGEVRPRVRAKGEDNTEGKLPKLENTSDPVESAVKTDRRSIAQGPRLMIAIAQS